MQALPKSRLLRFVEQAIHLARRAVSRYSSKQRYTLHHREFSSLQKMWNARLNADLYSQRTQNGTANSRLERKHGAFIRSRYWWQQFRELTIICLTHNLDRSL